MAAKIKTVQNDGYGEMVHSVSVNHQKKGIGTGLAARADNEELAIRYTSDGIAFKVVTKPVKSAIASGFEIVGDADGKQQKELFRRRGGVGFSETLKKAATWTRLYGGAVVVLRIADGRKLDEEAGNGKIVKLDSFSSCRIHLSQDDINKDENSPNYGEYDYYRVVADDGAELRVHYTRCVLFHGEVVPDSGTTSLYDAKTKFFGMSSLQIGYERLRHLGMSEEGIADMMSELNIAHYQINELAQILNQKDGIRKVRERLQIIEEGKSLNHAIISDVNDRYTNVTTSLGGVPETTYRQMQMVSAAFDMPMAYLFGETNSGLSSTGEGANKMYAEMVESWRNETLTEPVETIVSEFVHRNLGGSDDVEIQWNPVMKLSDGEYVNLCNVQATMYCSLIDRGVLSPLEVRTMMFKGGHTFQMNLPETDED